MHGLAQGVSGAPVIITVPSESADEEHAVLTMRGPERALRAEPPTALSLLPRPWQLVSSAKSKSDGATSFHEDVVGYLQTTRSTSPRGPEGARAREDLGGGGV